MSQGGCVWGRSNKHLQPHPQASSSYRRGCQTGRRGVDDMELRRDVMQGVAPLPATNRPLGF